jgi:hypothetical protein
LSSVIFSIYLRRGKEILVFIERKHKPKIIFTKLLLSGTISPVELKKLRRCGSFDLSGPIIYQRL